MPNVASMDAHPPHWGTPARQIAGADLGLDSVVHQHKYDVATRPATVRAATQAFAMAGLTPSEPDVTGIHEFVAAIDLVSREDLDFAERFNGYELVETKATPVGGSLPVNFSGELLAKGRPPGATGVAQCVELIQQLRGQAVHQVDGARIALAYNIGGPTTRPTVSFLEGPGANGI